LTKIILLFGLGLLLMIAEVLIPSMGVLGTLATLCVIGSIAWGFALSSAVGVQMLVAAGVLVPIFLLLAFKLMPYSPLTRKLMARGFSFEDGKGTDHRNPGLLGETGTVESPLRPAGMARIGGRRVDVVSRGELIERGTEVKVIEVQGNRVVVVRHGAGGAGEGMEGTA
jgi:membrane-bound serine protease (ClpP class)